MLTERIETIRQNYVNSKPCISTDRARIWTESHKRTEGQPVCILTSKGIILYANRYADEAKRLAAAEKDMTRKEELLRIEAVCRRVPEYPPENFYEAIQFVWFTQIGGILSENPLSLNPGRFDQYMDPYYEKDLAAGTITPDEAQELIDALWLKYSEWVWTISANTADYFAGYNQFQNLTVGGRTREGLDATNPVIVGVNAFEENIEAACAFLEEVQASHPADSSVADGQESGAADISLEFLPYHRYGMDKYAALGIPDPDARYAVLRKQIEEEQTELQTGFFLAERMEIPSEELLERYREIAAAHHIRTVSFR